MKFHTSAALHKRYGAVRSRRHSGHSLELGDRQSLADNRPFAAVHHFSTLDGNCNGGHRPLARRFVWPGRI